MVAFLLLNGGAVLAALLVAYAAGARVRTSLFALCTLCASLVLVHSAVLATGLIAGLTVGGLTTFVTIVLGGAWLLVRRANRGDEPRKSAVPAAPATLFAPLLAVTAAAMWAWPHLFHATRLWIWDDYTYHMVYPALWLREHAIAAVAPPHAFTMQAWYPLSASVVSTWFMVPFAHARADALAWVSVTGVLYAGIIACAAAELLARLGCRRGAWAVPLVLVATSQRIDIMASSFSDADLATASVLFAALVFATPRSHVERADDIAGDAAFAALLTGIAIGVKVTAVPVALVVVVMMALRTDWRRVLPVFAAAWAVTGGYWYVRNVVHTGNPLYPAAFMAWPGTTFPHTTLREYRQQYGLARTMGDALEVYLNWPRLHAALAILALVGLAGWLVARRRAVTRPQASFACAALAVTALVLVLLPATPYSAGNGMTFASGLIHWDSMRYVALLPILGWAALGFLVDAGAGAPPWRTGVAIAITTAAVLNAGSTWRASLLMLAVAIAGATLVACLRPGRVRPLVTAPTIALGMAAIVMGSHGAKAAATGTAIYDEPLFGPAAAVLDRQPAGTRVAVFGDQWIYPTFGARHDLIPVRLDRDGRIATAPIGDAMEPGTLTVDPLTFRANLAASGIGIVAVIHLPHPGRAPAWPTQAAALETINGARVLYRNGWLGIWKLGD